MSTAGIEIGINERAFVRTTTGSIKQQLDAPREIISRIRRERMKQSGNAFAKFILLDVIRSANFYSYEQ